MHWQTSRRGLDLDRPLVMGILNVTPDSFSDGGSYLSPDDALRRAEAMIGEGADIIDIGGESTRPGSERVPPSDEIGRTANVIGSIANRFDTPISIDTTRTTTARAALDAGAEIINDISGLRWDAGLAQLAADTGAGLVIMHSRGDFETMHSQPPVADIFAEVTLDLRRGVAAAKAAGVDDEQIVLDIGIGFGKTPGQNLELLAGLGRLADEFPHRPLLVGTSRKSFIARVLDDTGPFDRVAASIATAVIAVARGARIVRVHDVRATVDALKIAAAVDAAADGSLPQPNEKL